MLFSGRLESSSAEVTAALVPEVCQLDNVSAEGCWPTNGESRRRPGTVAGEPGLADQPPGKDWLVNRDRLRFSDH